MRWKLMEGRGKGKYYARGVRSSFALRSTVRRIVYLRGIVVRVSSWSVVCRERAFVLRARWRRGLSLSLRSLVRIFVFLSKL